MYDVDPIKSSPAQHSVRIRIDEPDWETVSAAVARLQGEGAPSFANLVFTPWNAPETSYYIIAMWWEQMDGTLTKQEHPEEVSVGG